MCSCLTSVWLIVRFNIGAQFFNVNSRIIRSQSTDHLAHVACCLLCDCSCSLLWGLVLFSHIRSAPFGNHTLPRPAVGKQPRILDDAIEQHTLTFPLRWWHSAERIRSGMRWPRIGAENVRRTDVRLFDGQHFVRVIVYLIERYRLSSVDVLCACACVLCDYVQRITF